MFTRSPRSSVLRLLVLFSLIVVVTVVTLLQLQHSKLPSSSSSYYSSLFVLAGFDAWPSETSTLDAGLVRINPDEVVPKWCNFDSVEFDPWLQEHASRLTWELFPSWVSVQTEILHIETCTEINPDLWETTPVSREANTRQRENLEQLRAAVSLNREDQDLEEAVRETEKKLRDTAFTVYPANFNADRILRIREAIIAGPGKPPDTPGGGSSKKSTTTTTRVTSTTTKAPETTTATTTAEPTTSSTTTAEAATTTSSTAAAAPTTAASSTTTTTTTTTTEAATPSPPGATTATTAATTASTTTAAGPGPTTSSTTTTLTETSTTTTSSSTTSSTTSTTAPTTSSTTTTTTTTTTTLPPQTSVKRWLASSDIGPNWKDPLPCTTMSTDQKSSIESALNRVLPRVTAHFKVKQMQTSPQQLTNFKIDPRFHQCLPRSTLTTIEPQDRSANLFVVVTSSPVNTTKYRHWRDDGMWAMPCAFDRDGRPVAVRVNFLSTSAIPPDGVIEHWLFHALGGFVNASAVEGAVASQYEAGLSRSVRYATGVTPNVTNCTGKLPGMPLDDDYVLDAYGAKSVLRASHWEPRVVGAASDLYMTPNPFDWIDTTSSVSLASKESVAVLVNKSYYEIVTTGSNQASASASRSLNFSCLVATERCNSTAVSDQFCFPPTVFTNGTSWCTETDGFLSRRECNVTTASKWNIKSSMQYYAYQQVAGGGTGNVAQGGNSPDTDFCPSEAVPQQRSLCSTSSASDTAGVFGNSASRCFAMSSRFLTQSVGTSTCFKVRCPFGVRVEFQNSENTWTSCPLDGSAGLKFVQFQSSQQLDVWCPPASQICGPSSELTVGVPSSIDWHTLPGSNLEIGAVNVLSTLQEARGVCETFGGAQLAFVPSAFHVAWISKNLLQNNQKVGRVGLVGEVWDSDFGYSVSASVNSASSSQSAVIQPSSSTSQLIRNSPDAQVEVALCMKKSSKIDSLPCLPDGGTRIGSVCVGVNTTNYNQSRAFFSSSNSSLGNLTDFDNISCPSSNSSSSSSSFQFKSRPLSLQDFKPSYDGETQQQRVEWIIQTLQLDTADPSSSTNLTRHLWTGIIITGGSTTLPSEIDSIAVPPQSGASSSSSWRYVLRKPVVNPENNNTKFYLFPIEISPYKQPSSSSSSSSESASSIVARFYTTCVVDNSAMAQWSPVLSSETHSIIPFFVPLTDTQAKAACADMNASLAIVRRSELVPAFGHLFAFLRFLWPDVPGVRVGGQRDTDGNAIWPSDPNVASNEQTPSSARYMFLPPSSGSPGNLGLSPSQTTTLVFSDSTKAGSSPYSFTNSESADTKMPFACAKRLAPTLQAVQPSFCDGKTDVNGTVCWDQVLDSNLVAVASPSVPASGVKAGCTNAVFNRSDIIPVAAGGFPQPSLGDGITRLYGMSGQAGAVYHLGVQYLGGSSVSWVSSSTDSIAEAIVTRILAGTEITNLATNDCIGAYFDPELKLRRVPCTEPLPYLCKALFARAWLVAGSNELEHTVVDVEMDWNKGKSTCESAGLDGGLALLPYINTATKFQVPEVLQSYIAGQPWLGFSYRSVAGDDLYWENLNNSDFSKVQVTTNAKYCYVTANDNTSVCVTDTGVKRPILCSRPLNLVEWEAPLEVAAGQEVSTDTSVTFKVKVPATTQNPAVSLRGAVVRISTNLSTSSWMEVPASSVFVPIATTSSNQALKFSCDSLSESEGGGGGGGGGATTEYTKPITVSFDVSIVESRDAFIRRTILKNVGRNTSTVWPCMSIYSENPTEAQTVTAGGSITVVVKSRGLIRPGTSATVQVYAKNDLTITCSPLDVTISDSSPTASVLCTSTANEGGKTVDIVAKVKSVSPTWYYDSVAATEITVAKMKILLGSPIKVTMPSESVFTVGSASPAQVNVSLTTTVPAGNYLKLIVKPTNSSFAVSVQPAFCSVTAGVAGPSCIFSVAALIAGTYTFNVTLELEKAADQGASEVLFRLGDYPSNPLSFTYQAKYYLDIEVISRSGSSAGPSVFAGEPVQLNVRFDKDVFLDPLVSDKSLKVIIEQYSLFNNTVSETALQNIIIDSSLQGSYSHNTTISGSTTQLLNLCSQFGQSPNGDCLITLSIRLESSSALLKKILLPPNPLPLVQVVPTKRLRLDFSPTDLFAGGLGSDIIFSLPQTPSGGPLTVDISYVASSVIVIEPRHIEWPQNEWNTNFSSTRTLTISAFADSVPYASFQGILVNVGIKVNDVSDVTSTLTSVLINIMPKRQIALFNNLPNWIVAGDSFKFKLRVDDIQSKFAPQTPDVIISSPSGGGSSSSSSGSNVQVIMPTRDQYDFLTGEIREYTVNTFANTTASPSFCLDLQFGLNQFYKSTTGDICFPILPRITVTYEGLENVRFSQPIGKRASQTFYVSLSSTPIIRSVALGFYCTTTNRARQENLTVAVIAPSNVTWTARALPHPLAASSAMYVAASKKLITVEGIERFQRCGLRAQLNPATGVNTGIQTAYSKQLVGADLDFPVTAQPIVFVNVLYAWASSVAFSDTVYVEKSNEVRFVVRIPQAPSQPMRVDFKLTFVDKNDGTDPGQASYCTFTPAFIVFQNLSSSELSQSVAMWWSKPAPNVTLTLQVTTTSGEFDAFETAARTDMNFAVNPSIVSMVQLEKQSGGGTSATSSATASIETLDLYCGAENAAADIFVNFDNPVPSPTAVVLVKLKPGAQSLVTMYPSSLVFTSQTAKRQPAKLLCLNATAALGVKKISVPFDISGMTVYAPAPVVTVTLFQLVKYATVSPRPRFVIGVPQAFSVRPEQLPFPGTHLQLELITTCGSSIRLWDSGFGLTAMRWTSEGPTAITVDLAGIRVTADCVLALVTSENSTASNYERFALPPMNAYVLEPPKVLPQQDQFLRIRGGGGNTMSPGGPALLLKFALSTPHLWSESNASLQAAQMTSDNLFRPSQCVLVSTTPVLRDQGSFFTIYSNGGVKFNLQAVNKSTMLTIVIDSPNQAIEPPMPETVSLIFTKRCFQDESSDPHNDYKNYSFVVQPASADLAAVTQDVRGGYALAMGFASLSAGPALATQGVRLSVLKTCGQSTWRITSQQSIPVSENPFDTKIGSLEDLGGYFGAAIMNSVFVLGCVALHLFAAFCMFASRRDSRVASKTFANALSRVRFPSLLLFPVGYFGPIIVSQALKVVIYSPATWFQIIGGLLTAAAAGIPLGYLINFTRKKNFTPEFDERKDTEGKEVKCPRLLWARRGLWSCEHHYSLSYSFIFGDYIGKYHNFLVIDWIFATCIGVVAAIEPEDQRGCMIKLGFITFIFLLNLVALLVARPFIRHIFTICFVLVTAAQTAAAAALIYGIFTNGSAFSENVSTTTLMLVSNMLLLKTLGDIMYMIILVLRFLFPNVELWRSSDNKVVRRFDIDAQEMNLWDLAPHLKETMEERAAERSIYESDLLKGSAAAAASSAIDGGGRHSTTSAGKKDGGSGSSGSSDENNNNNKDEALLGFSNVRRQLLDFKNEEYKQSQRDKMRSALKMKMRNRGMSSVSSPLSPSSSPSSSSPFASTVLAASAAANSSKGIHSALDSSPPSFDPEADDDENDEEVLIDKKLDFSTTLPSAAATTSGGGGDSIDLPPESPASTSSMFYGSPTNAAAVKREQQRLQDEAKIGLKPATGGGDGKVTANEFKML